MTNFLPAPQRLPRSPGPSLLGMAVTAQTYTRRQFRLPAEQHEVIVGACVYDGTSNPIPHDTPTRTAR